MSARPSPAKAADEVPTITKAQARSLAVSYSAYRTAREQDDLLGIRTWGRLLIEDMAATGVALHSAENVRILIADAARRDPTYGMAA